MTTLTSWKECWPTDQQISAALADNGGSLRATAAAHGVSRDTISRHLKGERVQVAGQPVGYQALKSDAPTTDQGERTTIEVGLENASAEFVEATLDPSEAPSDQDLLRRANLNGDWEVTNRRTSVWEAQAAEGETKTLRSLRVSFGKKKETLAEQLLPAFGGRPISIKPPARRKANERTGELVCIMSDFHAPQHDEDLLRAAEQQLLDSQPDRLILAGDIVDFDTVSRHRRTTLRGSATANECVQAGGEILARLRAAVPADCRVQFVPGNHDAWLNNYLLEKAGAAYDLCVAGSETPVWSLANLFQFEALGIELVGEADTWPHSYIQLTDHLVVKHGETARAGSGASPLAEMKATDYAVIHGHTHRAAIVSKTVWTAAGERRTYQGAEIGAMCRIDPGGWPTYKAQPDWSPGFATAELHEDGRYVIELATWQNGVLCWRGRRY